MTFKQWLAQRKNSLFAMNSLIVVGSVFLCSLLLLARLPGMELAGITPNWFLVWVVSWSVQRSVWQGAIAGMALGLIQDSLTVPFPSHAIGLAVAGILTALLKKQRYLQEDFISIALIVFGMAVVAETCTAIQFCLPIGTQDLQALFQPPADVSLPLTAAPETVEVPEPVLAPLYRTLPDIWQHHQRVALGSAILSSLWAPVLYYPLRRWWQLLQEPSEA